MDMDTDMQHGHGHGHAAWTRMCSMDMDMQFGHEAMYFTYVCVLYYVLSLQACIGTYCTVFNPNSHGEGNIGPTLF
jgi:hypothetical protein